MRRHLGAAAILLCCVTASAKTFYLSPSGNDKNSCQAAQGAAWPKKTFSSVFSCMAAGDTLYLEDGTYSVASETGIVGMANQSDSKTSYSTPSGAPPNGIPGKFTVIAAVHPGKSRIVSMNAMGATNLALGTANRKTSYLKFEGITFEGGINAFYNADHIVMKSCGFHSQTRSSSATIDIGSNDHDQGNSFLLFEDIWVWGQERAVMAIFRADHIVVRRMVGRYDGCDLATPGSCGSNSGNAVLGVTAYNSDHVSLQNVVMIDDIRGPNGFLGAGDFQTAYHNSANGTYSNRGFGANEWLGTISLNTEFEGIYLESDNNIAGAIYTPMYKLRDVAALSSSNPRYSPMDVDASNSAPSKDYNVELDGGFFYHGAGAGQDIFRIGPNLLAAATNSSVKNIVAWGMGRYGINSSVQASYTDTYGAQTDYNQTTPSNSRLKDPMAGTPPSVLYPVRIEPGSFLATAGHGGRPLGATILNRVGREGTFYGEAGFDSVGDSSLWPWPNQETIKEEMCSGILRGWCAKKDSLTEYVWGYFGHMPPKTLVGVDKGSRNAVPLD